MSNCTLCNSSKPKINKKYCNSCKSFLEEAKRLKKSTCKGCFLPLSEEDTGVICRNCQENPLSRKDLLKKSCKRGHKYSEVGIQVVSGKYACKKCVEEKLKANWQDLEKQEKYALNNRKSRLKKEFQLTIEDWEKMYDLQEGKCAICKDKIKKSRGDAGKKASVDHCHKTGLIRGLICSYPCNYILGQLHDKSALFRACAEYLDNPPATRVFGSARFTLPGKLGTKKRAKLLKLMKNLGIKRPDSKIKLA